MKRAKSNGGAVFPTCASLVLRVCFGGLGFHEVAGNRYELQEAEERYCQFVVAHSYSAALLDVVDEAFNHVAELVLLAIKSDTAMSSAGSNGWLGASRPAVATQRIASVCVVPNDLLGFEAFQQNLGADYVMSLRFCQIQLDQLDPAADCNLALAAETAAGWSQGLGV
jgi:hypothetical protein